MKKLIKFFSVLIFIFCIFPCFQMCSDNLILKLQNENEVIVDTTLSMITLKVKNDSLKKLTQEKRDQELERVRRQWTANAYELGFSGFREFKIEDFKDWTLYPMLCFTVFILLSIFVLFFAFKEHLAKVYKISIFNLGLIISSILIFVSKVGFDIMYNIKYGYYLLLLNIIILIILSKSELDKNSR